VLAIRNNMCAMARSLAARQRSRPVPARTRSVRAAAATGIGTAAFLAVLAAAPAAPANAQPADQPASVPLTVAVTAMSPAYAKQGQTVTIRGEVRNLAASPATGLSVQLVSSRTQLHTRSQLEAFAAGDYLPRPVPVRIAPLTRPQLGPGYTWHWTIRLPVKDLGLSCFGVYPLAVQVTDAAFQAARDPVPLPYWPAKASGCAGQRRPQPSAVSWIWPLIDTPHQGTCAGLINNSLAASIASSGRLGSLLAAGSRYAARAKLTWAIDPALLDSVRAMRNSYEVGASASCRAARDHPGSRTASRWLAGLVKATTGQPVFLTPYADVDVAALTRNGNIYDLNNAFVAADKVGEQILHRNANPISTPAGPRPLSAIAWPADGVASNAVLTTLAQHVKTVILAAPAVSPVTYTPSAVSSKLTRIGTTLHVLLADSKITSLLGSNVSASRQPGSVFGTSQLYLAETAMISSEAPGIPRPIVVAPPRRWNPSGQLANGLLADTVQAPWLKPSTADQLATMPAEHVYPAVTRSAPSAELPGDLLRKVSKLDHQIALLQSIRVRPDPALGRAVSGIESSAWRGEGLKHAHAMLARTTRYVNSQLQGISIQGVGRHATYHVTFGGSVAPVNVVVHSQLHYSVQVGLLVRADNATVTGHTVSCDHGRCTAGPIIVPPGNFSFAVKLTVHVHSQHGKIRLSLIAPQGSRQPLPAYPLVIVVHPTDFGTIALGICAVALALFVIGSAFRAIKLGKPAPPDAPDDLDDPADEAATPTGPRAAAGADPGPGFVPPHAAPARPVGTRSPSGWVAPPDHSAPHDRGAGIAHDGFPDLANRPEYPDSVGSDRSDLASAGPSVVDQEPASPSRRATEER